MSEPAPRDAGPTDTRKTTLALGIVFPLLAIVAVAARFYARKHIKRMALKYDDWMLIPALILSIGNAISMFCAAYLGDMGVWKPTDAQGRPMLDNKFPAFYKCIFANKLLTTVAIAVTRYAILLFYNRIFRGKFFNWSVWTLYIINGAWGIAYTVLFIFNCKPISDGWKSPAGSKGRRCLPLTTAQSSAVSSVIIDFFMLVIPWVPIMRLNMTKREKAAVIGIFGLGFIVLVVAIGKTVEFYTVSARVLRTKQAQYEMAPTMYWTIPETCIAVVGACLPTLRPLFRGWSPESVIGSIRSALSLSSNGSQRPHGLSSSKGQSHLGSQSAGESIRGLRNSQEGRSDYELESLPKLEAQKDIRVDEIRVDRGFGVESAPAGKRGLSRDDPSTLADEP
ncbi:hypothetical protein M011DRAFT_455943 [Sporormia fimetaria CBS 119925]|uniref:Rhodopsin domain-containing protein n=1 Tax=Sporormia fimetaria CBS 119925 TaxID=1340428 RepID=A0A6A6VMM5_9PLEO|nr:hypothetical protein M011DRAFT_455943 [Sporormia fimetaria CBS 119925]